MLQPNPFQLQPLEPVNVKDAFLKYSRNWGWFLLSVVVCVFAAFLYLRYATTEYRIQSTILITDDSKGSDLSKMNNLFSDLELFKSGKNIDDEIEVIKGKTLMQRVLRDLNLQVAYQKKGKIKNTEVYGSSVPVKILVSRVDSSAFDKKIVLNPISATQFTLNDITGHDTYKFGQLIKKPYGSFTVYPMLPVSRLVNNSVQFQFRDMKKLVQDYLDNLTLNPVNKNGNVLKLALNNSVPAKGIDVLNKLVEYYNLENIENKNETAAKTIAFIDDRLIYLVKELSGVEKDVENYKKKNDVTDISSESQQYLQSTGDYDKKLGDYEIQISILQSIENYITSQKTQSDLVPSSLTIQDPTLVELINSFNQLQLQRKRLLKSNYETNPVAINLADQISTLRQNILEDIRNIKKGLIIARNSLSGKNVKFESLKKNVPSIERELLEIKRQQNIKENLYQYLLQKREEASLSKAAAVSNLRIIDKADVDDIPVKPKRSVIFLAAILVGFILPISIISIVAMLNNKVANIDDVKKIGAPVLGEIIHTISKERFLIRKDSRTVFSEMFRLLRSKLQLSAPEEENKVLLITSTMSGEGKTFFSINMGATLALAGKKVIILEFDLRKPRLLSDMGLSASTGITHYLVSGAKSIDNLIQPVPNFDGLYIMGSGEIPPNPSELILNGRVNDLFAQLREQFDHILIDSPPVGLIADAYNLSAFADRTLYMIRYNYTLKSQINIIKDLYDKNNLRNLMLILNDGRKRNMQGYGGYGYNYSYGYMIDEDGPNWFEKLLKNKKRRVR
jgi:tyrosine-protein kinase Etk/Wzc